ncbi:hypothetical protein [Streptomyces sp. KL115B]|uniref:hypothetical protein n=1 Tax=Streptomyces sp. KL115B TaxID=3045154 RepID=UPI00279577DD|nr:hypothetical protein [Streptomyces sp. KL115B]
MSRPHGFGGPQGRPTPPPGSWNTVDFAEEAVAVVEAGRGGDGRWPRLAAP